MQDVFLKNDICHTERYMYLLFHRNSVLI